MSKSSSKQVVIFWVAFSANSLVASHAESPPDTPPFDALGLHQLVQRIIELDPELESLRGDIEVAKASVREIPWWDDPELRFAYQQNSNEKMARPYTETITHTREDSTAPGRRRVETSTRDVFPSRNGEKIVETTRIQDVQAGASGAPVDRLSRTETSQRVLDYDRYQGPEDWSAQLRLYPLNPWERASTVRQRNTEASLAEQQLMVAQWQRTLDIKELFCAARYDVLEAKEREAQSMLLHQESEMLDRAAQQGIPEERRHRTHAAALEARLDAETLHRRASRALEELAADADLPDTHNILLSLEATPVLPSLNNLSIDHILAKVSDQHPEILASRLETIAAQSEWNREKATRIPWVGLLAAEYSTEHLDGRKNQEAFTIMAGIKIPLFSWAHKNFGASRLASVSAFERREERILTRSSSRTRHALIAFQDALKAFETYQADAAARETILHTEIEKYSSNDPASRRTHLDIQRALIDLRVYRLRLERRLVEAFLRLEASIGFTPKEWHPVFP